MYKNLNELIQIFEDEFYKIIDLTSFYTIGSMNI